MRPSRISGWPKLRGARGDANVAGHGQLAAAADREAVDHGDGRLRVRRDLVEDAPPVHDGALLERRTLGELADVGAGDERLVTRAGEDDNAHLVLRAQASSA
jgi:hypothetical protein